MPSIKPFKGIVYNQKKIKKISSVVAPPYDVISGRMQSAFYHASPYNIIRLILGKIEKSDNKTRNRYTRARDFFESWLKDEVMVKDEKPYLYIYSQRYKKDKRPIEELGFIALMGLDMDGNNTVLPHENTLARPKLDRMSLMRSVNANLSPIFVLYEDRRHQILSMLKKTRLAAPFIDVTFDGVRHRVWRMRNGEAVAKIGALMSKKDIFIADGHHRYEVARAYCMAAQKARASRAVKEGSRYMMAYFVETDEKMLTILPTHRLIKDMGHLEKEEIMKKIERSFHVERAHGLNELMSALNRSAGSHSFGMYLGQKSFYLLRLKNIKQSDDAVSNGSRVWKRLDVSILHFFLIQRVLGVRDDDDNIEFVKNAPEAVKLVEEGKFGAAFFLNPTRVSQVKRIAKLGERMPRKATYFYPKPLSGLVINKFS